MKQIEEWIRLFEDKPRCREWVSHPENLHQSWEVEPLGAGTTALHVACHLDLSDVVLQLLAHGAGAREKNAVGQLAIHLACCRKAGGDRTVGHLLAYQSPLNLQDEAGRTALHEAAEQGNLPLVRLLLDQEANPLILTKAGKTPMDLAEGEVKEVIRAKTLEILDRDEFPTAGRMWGLRE
ncbi:MAG: ankyrin repeat domain-containing protein [Candidatus Omnitrophica bacterium]|nr:ankyrin repeat domain-containing protein [Candidatus Omnitrophota bacterium]